jgi:fatty acid desaturase
MMAPGSRADAAPVTWDRLHERSDRKGLTRLAVHLGLLIATGSVVCTTLGSWLLLPAMMLHGVIVIWLFAPLHEGVHYTPFRTRRLNEIVAWMAGAAILRNSTLYRHFHMAHHRFCQDPARDPELAAPKPSTRLEYIVHLSGLPFWWTQIVNAMRVAAGRFDAMPYVPVPARRRVRRSMIAMLGLYGVIAVAAITTDPIPVLVLWIVPAMLGQPALRGILLAEHTGCPEVKDNFNNTRTTFTTWPIRVLMWNMSYHTTHHVNPAIPFHALPTAHVMMRDRVVHRVEGYRRFHAAYIRGLIAR